MGISTFITSGSVFQQQATESHELAKSVAYDPIILRAVRETSAGSELRPIVLSESYMREAGRVARKRIIVAGLRLAAMYSSRFLGIAK